ncbi:hypothetical protein NP493_561g01009 [Ridgeia piscesae]|uniref:Uncharacterized protein n=1 Tax=Ridgeia piscesae TaxID=27915 RepID=A0AAD9KWF2_RIDPI|nr:hypothetical protein NP493_561g01009 [Ridgeia piscesae]
MCSERTMNLWYIYTTGCSLGYIYLFVKYSFQINTRQTSFEAWFDSKRKSRDYSAP